MRPVRVLLLMIGVGVTALSVGYWHGLRQGANFGGAFSSALDGSRALRYQQAIEEERSNLYAREMESKIDEALILSHFLEDEFVFRLAPTVWGTEVDASRRESLTTIAGYRRNHPSPDRPEALDALRAQIPEAERATLPGISPSVRKTMVERQQIIGEMVTRYGGKASQLQ